MFFLSRLFYFRPTLGLFKTQKSFISIVKPPKILNLSSIKLPKGSQKKKKRVGRGGQLRTAGRGRKGFKHRHGKQRIYRGYEGGQSSFVKKMPKIGIQKRENMLQNRRYLRPLYLDTLQQWVKLKRLDPSKPISIQDICKSGVAGKVKDGVVLLAKVNFINEGADYFNLKLDIEVTKASQNAIKVIEQNGGKVTTVYHDKARIHSLLNPEKYAYVPSIVIPPTTKLVGQYADENRRGYLAPLVVGLEREQMLEKILAETTQITLKQRVK